RDRSMVVRCCCRSVPVRVEDRSARRTCLPSGVDDQVEYAFPARTHRTTQPVRLADVPSRASVLRIDKTESLMLLRRNSLFQHNRHKADIATVPNDVRFWG